MTILVFGAEGIAGSALMRLLPDARGTTRRVGWGADENPNPRILPGIDIAIRSDVLRAIEWANPEVVINCAGIVKSECDRHAPMRVESVNGSAPHVIAWAVQGADCRLVHLSTDCVYDGTRGGRLETDPTDATDLYGQSKARGELVGDDHCVTIRTSFIGADPTYHRGLLAWLLAQRDKPSVVGFTRAIWNGLSAPELARVLAMVARDRSLRGLYHVAGPVITKADLLQALIDAYGLSCRVTRMKEPHIDRSLDDTKFRTATNYAAPSWADMAKELARDGT